MTKILKGDTSGNITIAFATGYDYEGSMVHVEFLGVRRSFANVTAGGTVSFSFTADETKAMPLGTFPVLVTLVKNGLITTVKNGGVKIGVTDDISEVRTGTAIAVDVKGGLFGIADLPARYTEADVVAKLREILRKGGAVLCAAFMCLGLFADTNRVQTARKDQIYNDQQVVTNVNLTGVATEEYVQGALSSVVLTGVDTNAVCAIVTNDIGGAWTVGRYTPDTYTGAYITNTAVRWSSVSNHLEVYLEGTENDESITGWYTGYVYDPDAGNPFEIVNTDYNSLTVTVGKVNFSSDIGKCVYASRAKPSSNALGLAYEKDIVPTITQTVTKAYVSAKETDPTVPSWAKAASKPTYTASEVGAKNDFEIGSGLTERETGNLYSWRWYTSRSEYTEYFTTSETPSAGDRLYNADGTVVGPDWRTVVSYSTSGGGTLEVADYASTIYYSRREECDILATPYVAVVGHALVLTNGAVQTLSGTSVSASSVGAVPTTRKVNGKPLTQDITIEGMTDNALVLTNDVVKTKSGTEITAELVGAYTKSESDAAYYPKASGEAWSAYWDGDEVRVTITNYYGMTDIPHLYLEQRTNDTGTAMYKIVWDEVTRWNKFLGTDWSWTGWAGAYAFKTNVTAQLASIEANKADRAWGFYDSHTGEYAPDGYTQVSSSNIIIAAGMGYQRTVTTSGDSYWVLTANEPFVQNGTSNGAFQLKDADGNVQIEIVKGDKRTVGARCGGVSVSGRTLIANYAVVASAHPTLEVCADLANPTWYAEDSASCPATVVWSGSSGAYVANVTPTSASATKIFVRASYLAGGETYVRHACPVGMSQIMLNGTLYNLGTATISGHTVLTLTAQ